MNVHRFRSLGPVCQRVIPIPKKVAGRRTERTGVAELLCSPRGRRPVGDGDLEHTPTLMREDHEDEEQANCSLGWQSKSSQPQYQRKESSQRARALSVALSIEKPPKNAAFRCATLRASRRDGLALKYPC